MDTGWRVAEPRPGTGHGLVVDDGGRGKPFVLWPEWNGNSADLNARRLVTDSATASLRLAASTAERHEADGSVLVTVQRTGGSAGAVAVNYDTANGTATAGQDYTAQSGTVKFADGETTRNVSIPIAADATTEPDETFTLALSGPGGDAQLGTPATATVTIHDGGVDTRITNGPDAYLSDLRFRFFLFDAVPPTGQPSNARSTAPLPRRVPARSTPATWPRARTASPCVPPAVGPPTPRRPRGSSSSTRSGRRRRSRWTGDVPATPSREASRSGLTFRPRSVVRDTGDALRDRPAERAADSGRYARPLPAGDRGARGPHRLRGRDRQCRQRGHPDERAVRNPPAPDTTITNGPEPESWNASPSFSFTSTVAGSTFRCSFDGGAYADCASGVRSPALASGDHTFAVYAVSPAGLADSTPRSGRSTSGRRSRDGGLRHQPAHLAQAAIRRPERL